MDTEVPEHGTGVVIVVVRVVRVIGIVRSNERPPIRVNTKSAVFDRFQIYLKAGPDFAVGPYPEPADNLHLVAGLTGRLYKASTRRYAFSIVAGLNPSSLAMTR